jgi:selenocysteine lyase/cysteine desulfurase
MIGKRRSTALRMAPRRRSHDRQGGLQTAERQFLRANPAYAYSAHIDDLRRREYARIDQAGHVYLDFGGGGLYADSQIAGHMELLRGEVLGNPHSVSPTSSTSTAFLEGAREAVLNHFGATADEYDVIFTPNATGALRLVGEAYPFAPGDTCLLTFDNHNSVNGLREFARARGAQITYVPSLPCTLRLDEAELERCLASLEPGRRGLFAFPAQSNFSGVQHSLEWIARARSYGWDVLLDVAAFVPTNRLDLGRDRPDFAPVSFYKMFGYPTGVGCLLARREALAKLERPWFSGGTIMAATVVGDWHRLAEGPPAFEDGTVNYLALPAVAQGLEFLQRVGVDALHARVQALASWLLGELGALRHANGRPAIRLYGPNTTEGRGATLAFNFLDPSGHVVDERLVDRIAAAHKVSLRTGCFCNPGGGEIAFDVTRDSIAGFDAESELTIDEYIAHIGLPSAGAVRVSLGLPSDFADVHRCVELAHAFLDLDSVPADLPERHGC